MKTAAAAAVLSCLFLFGCSRSDTEHANSQAREAGREIKKDLHEAGREIKKDLHQAGREIQKGANEVKREVNDKTDKR